MFFQKRDRRLDAQSALDELTRAAKTIQAARLNVSQAERVLEMMQNNYRYGAATTLDVLDSQRTLLGLEDSLFSTRTDRATAYIHLYQALGGGWSTGS